MRVPAVNDPPIPAAEARREGRRTNLKRMLNARSIAFIGGRAVEVSIDYCRRLGFRGEVWAVNPTRKEIGGVPCVPAVADLPGVPDTAWIAVSTERSIGIVGQLAAIGAPSAVCYTAGFSERGAARLERDLIEAAGDMALLGPNCMGFVNFLDAVGVVAYSHGLERPRRGVACIAQSGTIAGNMVMSDRSLPVSHLLSMGNQALLDLADGIAVAADDPRIDAIMLYVEGLRDAQAFADAAKYAFSCGKPIVCLKGGVSEAGRAIALSHTGSLAGTPELYEAFFDRLGIINVTTFPELLEMGKLLALGDLPGGNRLMVETCSGTDSGYCADLAARYGVELPQPGKRVEAALRKVLPAIATPTNPLDVTMVQWGDREKQAASLLALLEQPADAAALIVNFPSHVENPDYDPAVEAMIDVRRASGLPCYVITNLPEGAPRRVRQKLLAHGVVPLQGMEDALACLGRVAHHVERNRRFRAAGGPDARLLGIGPLVPGALLDEAASKAALRAHGVAVPPSRPAATADEAAAAAAELGFPVVVKGRGAALAHKTELGAVAVNLCGEDAVRDAAAAIAARPGVEGLLVETMITDAVAEMIVGVKRDPSLGLALVIGSGGVLTELLRDSVHLLLPTDGEEVRRSIGALRGAVLLNGYRGRAPGDVDAFAAVVSGIADYAATHAHELLELDVNPVLVRPAGRGAFAVDALIRLGAGTKA